MKCVIVLMAYLTFNVAVAVDCDTVDCRRQNSAVNPWHNLLVSRGRLLKDKVKSRGRFWNREMGLNSIRRGSVRWGKRFDSKQWQNAFKDLLRPTKLAMGRNWTPTITDVLPRENTEMEDQNGPVGGIGSAFVTKCMAGADPCLPNICSQRAILQDLP